MDKKDPPMATGLLAQIEVKDTLIGDLTRMIEDLKEKLEAATSATSRAIRLSDDNYKKGMEWKDMADKLEKQLRDSRDLLRSAKDEATFALAEAAELRGYIRRVNELDGKRRKPIAKPPSRDELAARFMDR